MQSQIQNYPDISFIGDLTLAQWIEQGEAWYIEQWKELTERISSYTIPTKSVS